jgi:hypothetical protein
MVDGATHTQGVDAESYANFLKKGAEIFLVLLAWLILRFTELHIYR